LVGINGDTNGGEKMLSKLIPMIMMVSMVIPMVEKKRYQSWYQWLWMVSMVKPMGGEKVSKLIPMIMNGINGDTNGWRKGIKADANDYECNVGEKKVSKLIPMIMNGINGDTNGCRKGIKAVTMVSMVEKKWYQSWYQWLWMVSMVIPMDGEKASKLIPMMMIPMGGEKVSKLILMIMNGINGDMNGREKGIKADTNDCDWNWN